MSERGVSRGFRPSPKQIGGGLLALLAVIFVFQNTQKVRVDLLMFNVESQLWIILLAMFALGAAAATLLRWRDRRRD